MRRKDKAALGSKVRLLHKHNRKAKAFSALAFFTRDDLRGLFYDRVKDVKPRSADHVPWGVQLHATKFIPGGLPELFYDRVKGVASRGRLT